MANTIILKRSATPAKVPTTGQLALGEIAINTYDGLIYIKKDNGTASVVQIGGVTSVNGETGSITISSDDVSDSGQTNKWFTNAQARSAISGSTGISYNSSTGVISTSQSITTSASPTFAGLTLTGNMGITGNIIPSADITYDLGSAAMQWKDIYVGPGSLYVNGSKVLEDDTGTITFSADMDQNIRIKTLGTGILQLGSSSTNVNIDGTMQIAAGKNITDSAGIKVNFGDSIEMNGNKVIGLGAPSSANDAATKTYVDTAIGNISTNSVQAGNSNISVVDTGTGLVTVTVDGTTALTVTASGVTVAGNFVVQGATTTVESNTISLADNIITLNSDATGAATQNAGLEVERGDDTNVALRWNEGSDKWTFTNDGATYLPVAVSTTDLAEGTNLYFTDARARTALSGSSGTGISYSSGTGAFSLGSIPNSSLTNTTVTIGSTSTALGATSTTLAGLTSVTSTGFTGALTGNASTATALATARTIAMSGDVAWTSLAFDGSGSVSSASTLATVNTSVGTYGSSTLVPVITVNGKGLVTSVTTSSISGALTFTGDVTGTGTTGASTALTIANSAVTNAKLANSSVTVGSTAIALGATSTTLAGLTSVTSTTFVGALTGNASTATSATTAGTITSQANSATIAAASANTASTIVLRDASGNFTAGTITAALTGNTSGTHTGAVVGNASTATSAAAWTTARTITLAGDLSGSVSIDGSANVTLTATVAGDTVALGTDTTGNYVAAGAVSGNGLSGSASSEGATFTVTSNATNANTASTIVFRDASGNFSAGTISAALTGNVTGNVTGSSGSTTGNAATVTSISGNTLTSGQITTGLGFTPYNSTNPSGYTTNVGTVTGVTGTAPVVSSGGTTPAISMAAATASVNGYMTSTYASKLDGIAAGATNVTNNNQITNGNGYYSSGSTPSFGATSTGALTVTGGLTATGEITAYYSDANLKKDIVEITDPIAKIMSIRGVTFRPNETALALGVTDKEEVGVIAQEVEAVLPQLVTPSAFKGYKTVKYDKLTALLVEAVKAQQLQIDALRAEIAKLGGSATTEL